MVIRINEGGHKFPEKTNTKHIPQVEGEGSITDYPDTEEATRGIQKKSAAKIREHKMKEGYRY